MYRKNGPKSRNAGEELTKNRRERAKSTNEFEAGFLLEKI